MALIWVEGFDALINTVATPGGGIQRRYESSVGTNLSTAPAVTELTSSQARAGQSANIGLLTNPLVPAPITTSIVGFAVRTGTSNSFGSGAGMALHNDAGEQLKLEIVDAPPANPKPGSLAVKFRVLRGATVLATSVEAFRTDATDAGWLWVEWKSTVSDAGGSFEVRVRPKYEKSAAITTLTWDSANTGIDTQNQATTGVNRLNILFVNPGTLTVAFDEIFMLDTTGPFPLNDFTGGLVFERLRVNADGNQTDWQLATATSHTDALDDEPGTIDDDRRLTSETTGNVSLVNVSDPVLNTASVACVAVSHQSRMESATGALTLGFRFRNGAVETTGATYGISTTTPGSYETFLGLDPTSGAAWVASEIPAYQFGIINLG